ncbi:TLC domain-containing protein 2 [Lepeophtheirus salmonis]|uniref:TLC domain-containing protein n=1 Tax=Lepeophtheirus salmonis TaxID=72036 RepID=A0A0K2TGR4_LEPSM|nr:TLC domain-containing protein 2-like [Lepeophtheirus salmonis]XP_040581637.1 TLC domain-containing protein 2-like [Lepeophtheirus salmonis]XP_040581644.1 TLC domain-containing protein 2-like [Lepeophtheirus salmonis]
MMSMQLNISQLDKSHYPLLCVAGSFTCFWALNYCIRLQFPWNDNQRFSWKWRNTMVSFIHSNLTGIWAPLCFVFNPVLSNDLVGAYDLNVHSIIAVSLGYFLYDFVDMSLQISANTRSRQTYQLLLHHFTVIMCFSIAVTTKTFLPYATLCLFIELNSIFLHARQLLILHSVPRNSSLYVLISYLNVGTFIAFRILLIGWLTRWLIIHTNNVPYITGTIIAFTLATIAWLNVLLFYRILVSDFLHNKKFVASS